MRGAAAVGFCSGSRATASAVSCTACRALPPCGVVEIKFGPLQASGAAVLQLAMGAYPVAFFCARIVDVRFSMCMRIVLRAAVVGCGVGRGKKG